MFTHPFINGNGRFTRLVADRYLVAYKCPYPLWPNNLKDNGDARSIYIQSLKEADKGNYDPLISLMRSYGAQDPSLSELIGLPFYRQCLSPQQVTAMVKALLQSGCTTNETLHNGHHPLQLAIKRHYEDIALLLIKHGADLKFRDKSGYDPFELAINQADFKLAKAICDAGYPYKKGEPPSLKIKYDLLYKFENEHL